MWRVSIITVLLFLGELTIGILFSIDCFNNSDLSLIQQSVLIAKMGANVVLVFALFIYMKVIGDKPSLSLLNMLAMLFTLDILIRFLAKAKFPADELHISNFNDLYSLLLYIVQIASPIQLFIFQLQRDLAIKQIIRGVVKDPVVQRAIAEETVLIKAPISFEQQQQPNGMTL